MLARYPSLGIAHPVIASDGNPVASQDDHRIGMLSRAVAGPSAVGSKAEHPGRFKKKIWQMAFFCEPLIWAVIGPMRLETALAHRPRLRHAGSRALLSPRIHMREIAHINDLKPLI
jgi:hypothetical protein